jgi:MFS family permease
VPREEIAAATALDSVYESLAAVGGPAVGGILIATAGVTATYGLDLATYAASLVALWALPRMPPHEEASPVGFRSVLDGFRFLRGRQSLLGIFAVDSAAMVFGMPTALFPALASHEYGGGARTLGYLYAAPYAGAFAGSLLSGWTSRVNRQGVAVALLASVWGASIASFGLARALWAALALLALAGGADFYSAVLRGTIVAHTTPDHLRGRISGIEFMQVAGAPNLGNVEAGVVAALTSLRTSIVSGGILCVAGCLLALAVLPGLRRYEARP